MFSFASCYRESHLEGLTDTQVSAHACCVPNSREFWVSQQCWETMMLSVQSLIWHMVIRVSAGSMLIGNVKGPRLSTALEHRWRGFHKQRWTVLLDLFLGVFYWWSSQASRTSLSEALWLLIRFLLVACSFLQNWRQKRIPTSPSLRSPSSL